MEALSQGGIVYPENDGKRLSENTAQFHWIEVLKGNLDGLLPDFVAADLLWYPIEGDNVTRVAPDVMVVLGRAKGGRSSYQQWEEAGVAPAAVFEVLSPGNDDEEMIKKHGFYETHGVSEYYIIDPDKDEPERAILEVWVLRRGKLVLARFDGRYRSPALGITFERKDGRLMVYHPDGQPFLTFTEVMRQKEAAEARIKAAEARRDALAQQLDAANTEREQLAQRLDTTAAERDAAAAERDAAAAERDAALARAQQLAEQMRAMGFDPDAS